MPSWVVPLFAACANAVICFVVYRHDRKSELNQIYCLCTLTLVGWNLNIFSLYFFSNAASAHYWSTVFRTGTLLMPPTVVHTFVVAGNRRSAAMRAYLVSAYVLVSALVVANAFGYLAAG